MRNKMKRIILCLFFSFVTVFSIYSMAPGNPSGFDALADFIAFFLIFIPYSIVFIISIRKLYFFNKKSMLLQNQQDIEITNTNDSPSFWFSILSFLLIPIGFILFLVYRLKKPKKAKSCGIGALVGFVGFIVVRAFLFIILLIFR